MPKIDSIYAFVTEDAGPDDEGVIGIKVADQWVPLVGANMERVESLMPIARRVAQQTQKSVKLLLFESRKEVGIIDPYENHQKNHG